MGANPGLSLFRDDDPEAAPVAYASVWRVDWSPRGAGTAIVVWHDGRARVVTSWPALGLWLAGAFTRHFPEVRRLPWPEPGPALTEADVRIEMDLATGMVASGSDVEVRIADPMAHELVVVEDFALGPAVNHLSTVYIPCRTGSLSIGGATVDGAPRVRPGADPSSTAFLADAEVWCDRQVSGR
jgi:hypothetical protein